MRALEVRSMKRLFPIVLLLLLQLPSHCQLLLSFPDPWPGTNKSAVAVDSSSGNMFITTAQSFNPHNKWKLFRYNNSSNTYDSLAGSAFGPASVTNKMLYRNNLLYLLNDKNQVRCFNTITNTWIWTSTVDNPGWEKINDIELIGDTLFIAGDFSGINTVSRWSIAALNRLNGSVISSWDPSQNGTYDFAGTKVLRANSTTLYIGGKFLIAGKLNLLGLDVQTETFLPWAPNPNDTVHDIEVSSLYLFVSGNFTSIHTTFRNRLARINILNHTLTNLTMGANGMIDDIELYHDQIFLGGSFTQIGTQGRMGLGAISLPANSPTNWNPGSFPLTSKIVRCLDKLFILNESASSFYTYCLAPPPGTGFSLQDPLVCVGDTNLLYQIFSALYANTYAWVYSGTGVQITPSQNSCYLDITPSASSGNLTVTPISSCGTPGIPLSTSITVQARPNAFAGVDDTITCFSPSVTILGTSISSSTVFEWTGPQNCTADCPSFSVSINGNYLLTVTDTLTGCNNSDTVSIGMDTIRPDVELPNGSFQITCSGLPILLDGSSNTPSGLLWWHDASNQNIQADPASYSSPGMYYLIVQNSINGCKDSAALTIGLNVNIPNSTLLSHPLNFPLPSDFFTCVQDSILLVGSSDTANTIINWINTQTQMSYANPGIVTGSGIYKMIVSRTDNQCADSSLFVFLSTDTVPPLYQLPASFDLSCSTDSILLDLIPLGPNTSSFWYYSSSILFPDPYWVTDSGKIYVQVTRNDNGCQILDSMTVGFTPAIEFLTQNDTMICNGDPAFLQSTPLGNYGELFFLWSTGDTGSQIIVYPSQSQYFTVQVSDSSGCYGTDTLGVQLPPNFSDSILLFSNCDGSDYGTIIVQGSGGVPPYTYSIDGGNSFQVTQIFDSVPFGLYQIIIRDSLGCDYYSQVLLDSTVAAPSVNFLVCTEAVVGDTLVAVDLSLPLPDTVVWYTNGPVVPLQNNWNELILLDTGILVIRMTAVYADCEIMIEKTVQIKLPDTNKANLYNQNGIREIRLFPNPSTGPFEIEVAFYKEQDFVVQLIDPTGSVMYQTLQNDQSNFSHLFDLSNEDPGAYMLRVVAEFDSAYSLLIISPN